MRSSHATRFASNTLSVFFAVILALGLVPAAAFAEPMGDAAVAAENSESASADSDIAQKRKASAYEDQATSEPFEGGEDAQQVISNDEAEGSPANVISSERGEASNPHVISTEPSDSEASGEISSPNDGDGSSSAALPAGDIINQEVALDTVAQAESTRSFFLAQTLESTKTVPVVSAKLPLDKGATESNNPSQVASTEDPDSDPSQHVISTEPSDSEASGEISAEDNEDSEPTIPAISAESTVIGSFEYRGITYAVEPGGESVAVVAADYAKLPTDFIEAQTIVLPSVVSPDGIDSYSVTRIADDAFASLTAAAAAAADNGGSADADSRIQAQAEACAYGDQATAKPVEGDDAAPQVISGVVSLSDDPSQHAISSDTAEASNSQAIPTERNEASSADVISNEGAEADPTPHVISSGASEAGGVEKSRPSDEGEGEALTVSVDESAVGVTAITISASITTIEDDAFSGFDTLQYVIVSEDNPNYSMYDGCLYDKPLSSLLLIPEGRLGAVRVAPSATTIDPEVFSHCALDAVIADPGSAASQLLQGSDLHNADRQTMELVATDSESGEDMLQTRCSVMPAIISEDNRSLRINEILAEGVGPLEGVRFASSDGVVQDDKLCNIEVMPGGEFSFVRIGCRDDGLPVVEMTTVCVASKLEEGVLSTGLATAEINRYATMYSSFKVYYDGQITINYYGGGNPHTWVNAKNGVDICQHTGPLSYYQFLCPNRIFLGSTSALDATHRMNWWHLYFETSQDADIPTPVRFGTKAAPAISPQRSDNSNVHGYGQPTHALPAGSIYFGKLDYETVWNADAFGGEVLSGEDYAASFTEHLEYDDDGNALAKMPQVRAREGLAFKGWTTDPTGKTGCILPDNGDAAYETKDDGYTYVTYPETQTVEITDDTTFYAVWTIDVNWNAKNYGGQMADGSESTTTSVIVNTPAELPAVADMGAGWTFEGWIPKGMTPPASGDPSYIKGTSNIPTITADMAAANADGAIEGYEGVWSLGIEYQREAGAIDGMSIDGASDSGKGTLAKSGIVYGTTVTAPTVKWPASHHFSHWTASDGTESTPGATEDAPCTIKVTAPGPVVAHWAPNMRDVVLNGNGSSTADQTVWSEYDKAMPTKLSDGAGGDSETDLQMPTREGYVFAGYWNTRYTEAEGTEEEVPTTKLKDDGSGEHELITVTAKRYYGVDDAESPTAFADMATWDITNDAQQLFAHWRYKISLNLNTFNSDGEIVLNGEPDATGAGFGANAPILADEDKATEQSAIEPNGTFDYEDTTAVPVQGGDGQACSVSVTRYTFTAIYGAPIQLPQVTGRTGYSDTSVWATTPGRNGIVGAPAEGQPDKRLTYADEAARTTDAFPFGSETGTAAFQIPSYDQGITLYADWDGRAEQYWVKLQAAYEVTIGGESDEFKVTSTSAEPQYVKATYDAPLPLDGLTVPVDATTAHSEASGADEPRNLRLEGYYTQKNLLTTHAGDQYLAVSGSRDHRELTDKIDGTSRTYKFRETNAPDQADVTVEHAVSGPAAGSDAVVLYGRWVQASSTITFNLNGGTISYGSESYGSASNGWVAPTRLTDVVTDAPVPEPIAELAVRPGREGFRFAGYWTHPYLEDGTFSERYYDCAEGSTAVVAVKEGDANKRWKPADDTVLYAHWKYDIVFDQGADRSGNRLAGPLVHLGGTAVVGGIDPYGNAYIYDGGSIDGLGSIRKIVATAGAPVKLPFATERAGYDPANQWLVTVDGGDAAVDVTADGWTRLGAASIGVPDPGSFVVPTAALSEAAPDATSQQVTLRADWDNASGHEAADGFTAWRDLAKRYWVALNAGYSYEGDAGDEEFVTQAAATVQYVQVRYEDYVPTGGLTVPVDATTVPMPGDATKTQPQNLLLEGFYDQRAGAADAPAGKLFVKATSTDADGSPAINGAAIAATELSSGDEAGTEFFTLTDKKLLDDVEVNSANTNPDGTFRAEVDGVSTPAYDLWAKWKRPATVISFDMNDGGMLDKGATTDSTDEGKPNAVTTDYLASPGTLSVKVPTRSGYEFNGYWTEPFSEADAAERYYDANGNAERAWDFTDIRRTLYAHWTYRIAFDCNGVADGHGGDTLQMTSTVSPLRVLYGAAAEFDHTSSDVKRLRDGQATAYTFGGWLYETEEANEGTGSTQTIQKVLGTTTVPGAASYADIFVRAPWILTPDAVTCTAVLRAQWSADTWKVAFDDVPADMSFREDGFRMDLASPTNPGQLVGVAFDSPLSTVVVPPVLRGYRFQGFFTEPNGGGTKFYEANGQPTSAVVTADVRTLYAHYEQDGYNVRFELTDSRDATAQPTTGTLAQPTDATWHYGDDLTKKELPGLDANGLTFSRQGYDFNGWYYYPADLPESERTEANRRYIALYDTASKAYAAGLSDLVVAYDERPCTADELGGAPDGNAYVRAERTEAWTPCRMGGAQVTTWNTYDYAPDLRDVTFYAGWTPRTYTVTFNTNYQDGQAQNAKTFRYYYEQIITPAMIMQLGSTGEPKAFVGWNANPLAKADASDNWLLDAATGQKMALTADGHQAGGKFMPNIGNDALPQLSLHAIWQDEQPMNVYLFPGMRGTFAGTPAASLAPNGFVADKYQYSTPYELGTAEPLPTIDGWEFAYWQKLDPSEYRFTDEEAEAFKASEGREPTALDMLMAKKDAINGRVRTVHEDYSFGNEIYPRAYRDDAEPAQRYEDYYLVAVWKMQSDYRFIIDFGKLSSADDGFALRPSAEDAGKFQAKVVASGNMVYEHSFNVERQTADGTSYEATPDFSMPDAVRYGYTLKGFRLANGEGYELLDNEFAELDPGELIALQGERGFVSLAVAGKLPREAAYEAVWEMNRYRIVSDEGDEWMQVGYEDSFCLPWPAHKGGGNAFVCYSLSAHATNYENYGGRYVPDATYEIKSVIRDIDTKYRKTQALDAASWPMVVPVEGEDGVYQIRFRCHWNPALSVTVPTECTVLVDPEAKAVRPASTTLTTNAATPLEVVSLRYSMMKVDGTEEASGNASDYVFGLAPGADDEAAYLSVYPDANLSKTTLYYQGDSAYDPATGAYTDEAGGTVTPLLIDMRKNVIVPKTLVFSQSMSGAHSEIVSDALQLDDYPGFRPFSQGTNTLTISYGLVFKGVDDLCSAFEALDAIPVDSGQTRAVARLYYTIGLAPLS